MPVSYADWLGTCRSQLTSISDSSRLDSQLLLAHALQKETSHLLAWPENLIPEDRLSKLEKLLQRRMSGEPMAYILGKCEFWGMTLSVNKHVLVPRADTEVMVEAVLKLVIEQGLTQPRILDMGTGSGAISLALAYELPNAKITALDISAKALAVAQRNAESNQINSIRWIESDWFDGIGDDQFDIIISNPPYVAANDPHLASLKYEPDLALIAEQNGYADLQRLIDLSPNYLDSGWLFLEHGFAQAPKVRELMQAQNFQTVTTVRDIAGHERCTFGKILHNG